MFKIKGKSKWMVGAAGVVILGIVAMAYAAGGMAAEVFKVSRGEIKQYVEETAQVLPHEKQSVYIEGSGKITAINVEVGNTVKKGDVLLSLDKTELELQLKDAEARLAAAKAQLTGTELINYANKIELAKAALDQAAVSYDSAARNYENAKELFASQAISKDELQKAEDQYKTARAARDTADLQLSDLKKGTPEHVKSEYRAQLEQAEVYRDTVLRNLQKQELKADMDGVVIEKLVEVNSFAAPASAAFVIGNVKHLELEADILADDANKVKLGDAVEITGNPLEDSVLQGKVVKISPAAKSVMSNLGVNQKRVPVTIELQGQSDLLKPGYNVDVRIITARVQETIKVPDSAVFEYQGKSQVFVVVKGKAQLREVTRGIESGNDIEIKDGLKEGETVLTKPDNNIKEGTRIKI